MKVENLISAKSSTFKSLLVLISFTLVQMMIMTRSYGDKYRSDNAVISRSALTEKSTNFKPLVLVFEGGCSASTAIGRFIEKIINAHGFTRYNKAGFEFMDYSKKRKNPFYFEMLNETKYTYSTRDKILLDSVKRAKKEAIDLGQLFYFKAHIPKVIKENRKMMDEIGVSYVGIYRYNILDRCICVTKDCFANSAGYTVFKHNGTKAELCFNRRKVHSASPVLTHLVNPKKCLETAWKQQKRIRHQDFPAVSEESLFEFEYTDSDEAWERSMNAWGRILHPFLSVAFDESKVSEVLKEYRGSRSLPLPHSVLVSNYDYLVHEIRDTRWERYLRN